MYVVNHEDLQRRLNYYHQLVSFLTSIQESDILENETLENQLAFERAYHLLIESMLDIGHLLIDTFIMRDAASFADIFIVLEEEGVIPVTGRESYHDLLSKRPIIVKKYVDIDHQDLFKTLRENIYEVEQYTTYIEKFLADEVELSLHNLQ